MLDERREEDAFGECGECGILLYTVGYICKECYSREREIKCSNCGKKIDEKEAIIYETEIERGGIWKEYVCSPDCQKEECPQQ